jgi:hypothetical protein
MTYFYPFSKDPADIKKLVLATRLSILKLRVQDEARWAAYFTQKPKFKLPSIANTCLQVKRLMDKDKSLTIEVGHTQAIKGYNNPESPYYWHK